MIEFTQCVFADMNHPPLLTSAPVFHIPERTTEHPLWAYYVGTAHDDDNDVVNFTIISGNDNNGKPAFILEPYTGSWVDGHMCRR